MKQNINKNNNIHNLNDKCILKNLHYFVKHDNAEYEINDKNKDHIIIHFIE